MPHREQRKINNIGDHLIGIHCFILSMHVPWTAYSGISDSSPWSYYDPWLVCYDYQHPAHALPRSHDLYDRPPWPYQNFCY